METIEERRLAAKRKLEEAKEKAAAKQASGSQAVAKLRQEAPIGKPFGGPKPQSPKERAKELAEKAAAEKAARLEAQKKLRTEQAISTHKSIRELLAAEENATGAGAAWQQSPERQEAIKSKLAEAASSTVSQRLLNAKYGDSADEGVQIISANALIGAADPQLAAIYQYLQKRWQSPEVSGALMTLERSLQLVMGRVIDSQVRVIGLGDIERNFQGNEGAALDAIHSHLGYTLGDALGIPAPDFDIFEGTATFALSYGHWEECLPAFVGDFEAPKIVFSGGRISSLAYRYLINFFSQMILTVVENSAHDTPYMLPFAPFPVELSNLFLENMTSYYLPQEVSPALFETQPIRAFAIRQAAWLRQRGWGQ